jgi:hypothetical protein
MDRDVIHIQKLIFGVSSRLSFIVKAIYPLG